MSTHQDRCTRSGQASLTSRPLASQPLAGPPSPVLGLMAEIVHEGTAGQAADFVFLCGSDDRGVDLALWSIPPDVRHPTDVLVGWRPPEWATVVGFATVGEARSDDSIEEVRITVATAATGATATVLERLGHRAEVLQDPPEGWGSDALRRCLDLPTDPPNHGLHPCVEANWLSEVVSAIERSTTGGPAVSWEQVAHLHPLHPPGWAAQPAQLRAATAALELESSWERMAEQATQDLAPPAPHPPDGTSVPLDQWFDPGSFCRWSVRHLPELDDLLFEVLEAAPAELAPMIIDSLVSTTAWQR